MVSISVLLIFDKQNCYIRLLTLTLMIVHVNWEGKVMTNGVIQDQVGLKYSNN